MRWVPSEVLVGVQDHILIVIIVKQVVPGFGAEMESVMEDKLEARLLLFHHCAHIFVKLLQHVKIRQKPGLIDRLDSVESLMVTPGVEQALDRVLGPINIFLFDRLVAQAEVVPISHPFANSVVAESRLSRPLCPIRQA